MINLNRIGSGKKLIKDLVSNDKIENAPWARKKQKEKINNQKNFNKPKSK